MICSGYDWTLMVSYLLSINYRSRWQILMKFEFEYMIFISKKVCHFVQCAKHPGAETIHFRCTRSNPIAADALTPFVTRPSVFAMWDKRIDALQWRNGRDSVSNHQPQRRRSKNTSKRRVTGLSAGNSPGTGEFPTQMASYAENVSIWWRHHGKDPAWITQRTHVRRDDNVIVTSKRRHDVVLT